ncbi:MAG TPA: DUF5985 family protein [Pirellulales bacterium]|nr:DUF5985 family protein [Pirellulales bacterium]
MTQLVYVLCAATSLACALLLFRGYRQTGVRLLFWSGLCFLGLAAENAFLFVDVIVLPATDLSLYRRSIALAAFSVLVFGLVWDAK